MKTAMGHIDVTRSGIRMLSQLLNATTPAMGVSMTGTLVSVNQYHLTHEHRPEYLYVQIAGDSINYQIARSYWDEILVICERMGTRRLMVDKNIRAELSMVDEFRMASDIATSPIRRVKLALCDRHVSQANLNFGETVATNRGLNMRSFRDEVAAEKWLLAA
jgi:hypothetical protein